jgi:hypothetical protein
MTNLKELVNKPESSIEASIEEYLRNVEVDDFIKDVKVLIPVVSKPKKEFLNDDDFDALTKLGDIE